MAEATARRPSLLVLTDLHFPGWKARVDGRDAPLERVDYLLRGVMVPPGRHRVEFVYEPASWTIARAITLAGLLALVAALAAGLTPHIRRRRRMSGYRPQALSDRMREAAATRGRLPVAADLARYGAGLLRAACPGRLRGTRGSFALDGEEYPYLFHRYKATWLTERAVEVPVVQRMVDREAGQCARGRATSSPTTAPSAISWSTSTSGRPAS